MVSLESKLLDGKNVGYCSSSEGEDDRGWQVAKDDDEHQANVMRGMGGSGNTGPKGVLNDYNDFCEQSKRDRARRDRQLLKHAQRGMLQGRKEDRERAAEEADASSDEGESLESLREKRLREMRKAASGKMVEITQKDQYLKAIDGCGEALLCVLIYEPGLEQCQKMSHLCKVLAADYPRVKFLRGTSTILGMSKAFTEQGLPALQFYSRGQLVGNFIQMTSFLGMDYDARKLKTFLRKNRISLDRGCMTTDSEYSTDEDLD